MRWIPFALVFAGCGAFGAAEDEPATVTPDAGGTGGDGAAADGGAGDAASSAPNVIATKETDVSSIALDEENVFWTTRRTGGHVAMCPKTGCSADGPRVLATGQTDAHHVSIVADRVVWIADDRLRSMHSDGTGGVFETTDGFAIAPPPGYAALGSSVFVADGAYVRSCPNAFTTTCVTGSAQTNAVFGSSIADLHRSGSEIIGWTREGFVRRFSPTFASSDVYNDATGISAFAVESEVFLVRSDGLLRAVALTGGTPREIAGGLPAIVAMAVDASDVFMVSEIAGMVLRVPRVGGMVRPMKDMLVTPRAIAVDADGVFVGVAGTGEILRLPK